MLEDGLCRAEPVAEAGQHQWPSRDRRMYHLAHAGTAGDGLRICRKLSGNSPKSTLFSVDTCRGSFALISPLPPASVPLDNRMGYNLLGYNLSDPFAGIRTCAKLRAVLRRSAPPR